MRLTLSLLLAIALLASASPTAGASRTPRACGLVGRFNGRLYDVRETKGAVPCPAVRSVVAKFLRTGAIRPAHDWLCFRGHAGVAWAASCGRGKGVVVRVYAPT